MTTIGDKTVTFEPPFQRAKYADLFRQHVGCDMADEVAVRAAAHASNIATDGKAHDVVVQELFEGLVEEKLAGPVFVFNFGKGYPTNQLKGCDG